MVSRCIDLAILFNSFPAGSVLKIHIASEPRHDRFTREDSEDARASCVRTRSDGLIDEKQGRSLAHGGKGHNGRLQAQHNLHNIACDDGNQVSDL
jgi:hypothetical protein